MIRENDENIDAQILYLEILGLGCLDVHNVGVDIY